MGCNLCTPIETEASTLNRGPSPLRRRRPNPSLSSSTRISAFTNPSNLMPDGQLYESEDEYSSEEDLDQVPVSKLNLQ